MINNNNKKTRLTCVFVRRKQFCLVISVLCLLLSSVKTEIFAVHQNRINNCGFTYSTKDNESLDYSPKKNFQISDSQSLQTIATVKWNIEVFRNEAHNSVTNEDVHVFDFEVFNEKNEFYPFENASVEALNNFLEEIIKNSDKNAAAQVIFLNRNLNDVWLVKNGKDSVLFDQEEVTMFFDTTESVYYSLYIREPEDFQFFYVEPSGGIQNLRFLQKHLEKVLEKEQLFLIYYNSPSGGMVINKSEDLVNFYNRVFVSISQSPFPTEELRNVSVVLNANMPADLHKKNLVCSFYISEISYNPLKDGFIEPLLQNYLTNLGFKEVSAVVYTDFDVKKPVRGCKNINILNNKTP